MKSGLWLKILMILACIIGCNAAVLAEEQELATEVAVQTGKITKTTLHRYVMAYGMVEPEPAMGGKPPASSKIAAPMMGILTRIYCEEGQQVKKGALLFELDTRSTDALIAKAEVVVEFAQKNFARKQQLSSTDNVSRKLYDEAEQLLQTARKDLLNAKIQRELLQIKAPLSGTVATIHFKVGEAVSINTVMADLIDLDRLDIAIRVPSQEATALRLGQSVDISTGSTQVWSGSDAPPSQRGTVTFIGPQVDPLTDTLLVRASLSSDSGLHSNTVDLSNIKPSPKGEGGVRGNQHRKKNLLVSPHPNLLPEGEGATTHNLIVLGLRPGQFASARILVEERPERLAVPIESVVTREGSSVIAVVEGDRAKQTIITPGLRDGNLVEVAGENIREGMTIVTQGVYGLPAETRIRW